MAIVHTLSKIKDVYNLEVSQDTDFSLYYVCRNNETLVESGDVVTGDNINLTTSKDGKYKLVLSASEETDVIVNFTVISYLQKSLLLDMENILRCVPISNACDNAYNVCFSKDEKTYLQHKDFFVKLLTFQNLYLDSISDSLSNVFTNFLSQSTVNDRCSFQTNINKILKEECIYGSAKFTNSLLLEYVSLYYYGIYLVEKNLAGNDEEELAYIEDKFNSDTIPDLIVDNTCVDSVVIVEVFNEILSASNTKPTVDNFEITPANNLPDNLFTYTFDGSEFTENFTDLQGDSPYRVKFSILPVRGTFKFNGVNVVTGTNYLLSDIDKLVYETTIDENRNIYDIIQFQVSDDNNNELFSDMATVTINTSGYVNQPISQLGDLTLNKNNRENHVFTINNFTTQLVPPYVDPEGDSLDAIRIDSLPAAGQLQLNGNPVQLNDIIDAADINAGNFVFVAPDENSSGSNEFNFSARDEGSLQWVSS